MLCAPLPVRPVRRTSNRPEATSADLATLRAQLCRWHALLIGFQRLTAKMTALETELAESLDFAQPLRHIRGVPVTLLDELFDLNAIPPDREEWLRQLSRCTGLDLS